MLASMAALTGTTIVNRGRDLLVGGAQLVFDTLLPPRCPVCPEMSDGDGRFCVGCFNALRFITAPLCPGCGVPFDHDRGPGARCAPCLAEPPPWAGARAAFVYAGPARDLVLGLKHGDRQHIARLMAPHMVRAAGGWLDAEAVLVPVPLHRWRLWRRGFNQSALLARALARLTDAEIAIDALERVKPTPSTKGMSRVDRQRNVRGAFRVTSKEAVRDRDVVLVDDVLTSGATASACTRLLLRAGARRVRVLTLARALRNEALNNRTSPALDGV